mmetsp:Transcript_70081/g.146132  ORF Transcript_70081/g.146132 Transcript_70081/m.146132 type:complete len:263 (+) Transcript_70081:168-956(+)
MHFHDMPWFISVGAEFVGTFLFQFMAGAAVLSSYHTGLMTAAWGVGMSLVIVSYLSIRISGAHLNPAITLVIFLSGKRSEDLHIWVAALYMLAQFCGAICGAFLLVSVMPDDVALSDEGEKLTFLTQGMLTPKHGFSVFVLELVCTFGLTWAYFATIIDHNSKAGALAPFVVGVAMTVGVLAAGPATGASLNPARTIGPAVAYQTYGHCVAPFFGAFAGALLAGLAYSSLFLFPPESVPDLYRITAAAGKHEAEPFSNSRFV